MSKVKLRAGYKVHLNKHSLLDCNETLLTLRYIECRNVCTRIELSSGVQTKGRLHINLSRRIPYNKFIEDLPFDTLFGFTSSPFKNEKIEAMLRFTFTFPGKI